MDRWFKEQFKRNCFPIFMILILNIIGMSFNIILPMFMRYFLDNIIVNKHTEILMRFSMLLIILFIISSILDFIGKRWYCNIILKLKNDLKETIFNHIQRIGLKDFFSKSKGDYIATIINDSESVIQIFNDYLYPAILSIISLIIVVGILLDMSIELTIICLLSIPIFVITSKYFGAKIKQIAYKIRKDTAKHMEILDEGLSLIVTNKLYDYYEEQQKNYKEKVDDLMKNSYSLFINSIYSKQIFGLTASIFPIIILIQGGYKVAANEISVGMIVAFISYLSYLYNPVTVLSKLNMVIKEMKVSIKRIDEILNMNKENLYEYDSKIEDQDVKGNIEFKNVRYDINNKTILNDVSFTIKAGELVAIVGTNGVGKSTLLNLLLKLYDFDGDILIDDVSIKDMNTSSIRNLISIVPQRGSLYATSIRENIKIGKKDAKNDEIEQVLELVNLKSFIDSLEDGLDTEVFGNEVNLSGGEKQKILCARAFLKPSKILILDEALNAIDNESKEIIIKNILKMKEQKTIIMITHDPDNLKIVDKVIEIKSYN